MADTQELPPGTFVTRVTSTITNPETMDAYHHIEIEFADGTPHAFAKATARAAAWAILDKVIEDEENHETN